MIQNAYLQLSNQYHKKIAVFSDIHYTKNYSVKRLELIYQNLKKNKPDYICIVGDLLDQGNVLEDSISKYIFWNWLQKLANIAPLVISIGNHDVGVRNSKWRYRYPKELLEELSTFPNIHVLDNSVFREGSICFLGYTPPFDYYYKSPVEHPELYKEDIKQKISSLIPKDGYHILLCHTPVYVTHPSILNTKSLQTINLVLSGHMHNGIIPISIRGNYGIIAPSKTFFPKYARGNFKIEGLQYHISGGIITFSNVSPKLFHLFNPLFPIHIEYITI